MKSQRSRRRWQTEDDDDDDDDYDDDDDDHKNDYVQYKDCLLHDFGPIFPPDHPQPSTSYLMLLRPTHSCIDIHRDFRL